MSTDSPAPHGQPGTARAEKLSPVCDGCGRPLNPVESLRWTVCLDCTRARARTTLSGRCTCGTYKVPGEVCRVGSRSWIPCRRCLGAIRQLT